jgi:hypothetical protein
MYVKCQETPNINTGTVKNCSKIVIYEMSARRHFSRIILGTSDEGASASFARMCRIRLDEHYVLFVVYSL